MPRPEYNSGYSMQPEERPLGEMPAKRAERPPEGYLMGPDERPPRGYRRRPDERRPKGHPMRPDERPPVKPTVRPPKPSGCINLFFACNNAKTRFICEMVR